MAKTELVARPQGAEMQKVTTLNAVQSAFSSKALTKEQMNILRVQIAPDIGDADLLYCLEIADNTQLNPILKEIYFVPRMAQVNERWVTKYEPMVGRKGARTIARRKGMKIPPNTGHTIKKYPKLVNGDWIEERDLVGWAELVIEGQVVRKEAAFSIYKQTKKDGSVNKFWQNMPTVMVEKVAEFQLLDAVYGLDGVMSIDAGIVADDAEVCITAYLSNEIEDALRHLGVTLQKFNGVAIASNHHGKEKILQDFGFTKNGGNWSIKYEQETKQIQVPAPKEAISPAARLFSYLIKKGLSNEQVKLFVTNTLGVSREDTEGINEILSDLSSLDILIADFMAIDSPAEEAENTPSLFGDE